MAYDIGDELGQAQALVQVLGDAARGAEVAGQTMDPDTVAWVTAALGVVLQRAHDANELREQTV